ncbi:MAG: TrmH family RNA methyltransferase [Planctomycetota bacterium]
MPEKIISTQNPRIKQAIKLHHSRGRQAQGRIIIFGNREVGRAIDAGIKIEEIFLHENSADLWRKRLSNTDFSLLEKVTEVSNEVFEKIQYGNRSEALIAIAQRPTTDLIKFNPLENRSLLVVIDSVEKPGNLGAIARSADGCGAAGLLISNPVTDPFHPNSIRSSTGVLFGLPIAVGSSDEIAAWLDDHLFEVFVASLEGAEDFYATKFSGSTAIVLGNEATGVSENWLSSKDYRRVKIHMHGIADSLNVSATASVMMFEASRQLSLQNLE